VVDQELDCPIAGKRVVYTYSVRPPERGFPPVRLFEACTGLQVSSPDGPPPLYDCSLCPFTARLNG
jgi:hypothetical protein